MESNYEDLYSDEMSREHIYDLVNNSETIEELILVMAAIGKKYGGKIPGKTRDFDVEKQINNAKLFYNLSLEDEYLAEDANIVTRSFGLRQQLIYITYYTILNK